jgi:hypothetical protein
MKTEDQRDDTAPHAGDDSGGVHASRRRFTRAGLSASVVLGSLASKPVLGAPYHCTVSGQVSGNLSRAGDAANCVIGKPPSHWLDPLTTWPTPFVRGTRPNSGCQFSGNAIRGTDFNRTAGLIDAYYITASGGLCNVVISAGDPVNPATMLQVLASTNTAEQFVLGRVVVTSLLNATADPVGYPVTAHTIVEMFNSTFDGGTYKATSTKYWSRGRVIEYLQGLYYLAM